VKSYNFTGLIKAEWTLKNINEKTDTCKECLLEIRNWIEEALQRNKTENIFDAAETETPKGKSQCLVKI